MRSRALTVNCGNLAPDNKLAINDVMNMIFSERANPVTPNRMGAVNTVSDTCVPSASTPSIMRYPMSVIVKTHDLFVD